MTNLTDLLPAGAGGKQVSFTASGAISSGQTVGLNSDGTVSVIDSAIGDVATFTSSTQLFTTAVYDATNNKIVVFYRDGGDSNKGKAIVGTVSGTSIIFGTAVQFEAGLTNYIDAVFDPDSGKILVSYEDDTNSSYGTAIVGTVSGTSISFGTAVVFRSVNTTTTSITYDTNLDRVAIAFAPYSAYRRGEGVAGQVSGTSITFGSAVQFDTDNTGNTSIDLVSIVFDSTNNKVVIVYTGASQKIQGVVGTISGTSISFGTPADVSAVTDYRQPKAVFDSNAGKVFAIFRDNSDSYIKGAVGTVSGTSISFGTTATLSSITASGYPSAVYDPDNQNIKAIFKQSASPNSTYVFTATISGTSVSASGEKVLYASGAEAQQNSMTYDTSSNQVISAVRKNTTDIGEAFVHKTGSGIPNTNFIGIADSAISDTASGNITIKGGIASSGLSGLTPNATYYVQDDGSLAATSIPYDISSASYDSVSFSVATQETIPTSVVFNNDGTKMFVGGVNSDNINEYSLSTAYDVSTATYSQSFSVAAQDATGPEGIAFNTDGTKMFVVGFAGQAVNEYTLSTGFDLSTATYSQNFSVSAQDAEPIGLAFNTDGTKMFVVGFVGDDVNEYNLSTGFDVSTASYSQNFSVSSEDTSPFGIAFNSDGTSMFIIGQVNDKVFEYTLTSGFDVSTASYSGKSFSTASQETIPTGITFNSDGTKMYIIGYGTDTVYQYSTSPASTTVIAGKALSTTSINLDYSS